MRNLLKCDFEEQRGVLRGSNELLEWDLEWDELNVNISPQFDKDGA